MRFDGQRERREKKSSPQVTTDCKNEKNEKSYSLQDLGENTERGKREGKRGGRDEGWKNDIELATSWLVRESEKGNNTANAEKHLRREQDPEKKKRESALHRSDQLSRVSRCGRSTI